MTVSTEVDTALIDVLPDAVIEVDAERRVVAANRAAQRLTGYPEDALVGSRGAELLAARGADGRPVWERGWPRAALLRSVRGLAEQKVTVRRADGTDLPVLVTGTYLRGEGGRLLGAVLSARDARRAERRAERRAVSGIEIVSTVSHELRSPLTSVKGYTSLLLNRWERLGDDQKRMMLEQVNHDADRVTRLITELLDISRLESGRLGLRRQGVDLAALAASVVARVGIEYPELEAELRFPAGLPRAWADADKVEQVLVNLVENACKYASPRGIVVEGRQSADEVSVTVTDRGPGIPPADVPKLFDKFFRPADGKPTGSGLGLWISRGLVEAHGGRLVAVSRQGEGSSFTFTLPRADRQPLLTA